MSPHARQLRRLAALRRTPLPPFIRRCHKLRFDDELGAKLALATIRRRDNPVRAKLERRAYHCPQCAGWHLTACPSWAATTTRHTGGAR
jgi:hypothetical protein